MNDSGPVQNAGEVSTESGPVTIKADTCTPACSGHIITGTGTSNVNTITVTSGTHDITLQDVNIDVSSQPGIVAFSIEGSVEVYLTLNGDNILKSGKGFAGLQVPDGETLVITADSRGSLDATGGNNAAGIGGGQGGVGGTVNRPSSDPDVKAVSVDGIAGSIDGTTITVVLPYGTPLPTSEDRITITPAASAVVFDLRLAVNNGSKWTFTITAEDRITKENYTINISNAPDGPDEPGKPGKPGGSGSSGGDDSDTPTYSTETLTNGGVALTGDRVHECARLTVTKDLLHNSGTCSYCGQIRQWQQQGRVIVIYDVSLSYGFRGTVDVTFPVPSAYEGKALTVAHCLKDTMDTHSVTVSGGKVTVTADSLSPFVILDTAKGEINPDTGAVVGVPGAGVPGTGNPKAPQAAATGPLCFAFCPLCWRRSFTSAGGKGERKQKRLNRQQKSPYRCCHR